MFSYHPASEGVPAGTPFTRGFCAVDVDDVERIGEYMQRFAWSQSVFKDGYRHSLNFQFADWIGLDFDTPEMSLRQAEKSFCDMTHVIGTTRNHRKEKHGVVCDRFRVLLKPMRRITSLSEYRATVTELGRKYPVDRQCLEGARHWFPCGDIVSASQDGYCVEIVAPKRHAVMTRARSHSGSVRQRSYVMLRRVMPLGRRNFLCFTIAKDLYEAGYAPDEIYREIVASPTYRGGVSPELSDEIWTCVRNGIRSVEKGVSYG